MKPIKCPDCGTWWRGDEHRCYTELAPLQVRPNEVPFLSIPGISWPTYPYGCHACYLSGNCNCVRPNSLPFVTSHITVGSTTQWDPNCAYTLTGGNS